MRFDTRALSLVCKVTIAFGIASSLGADELAKSFRDPPASARPHTWWHWMNGRVTKQGITADLEWMQRVGIGGVQAFHIADGFEPGPVGYLSSTWLQMFEHAAREADRLGLEMCVHNCAGWSSSGGPWITPELAMQEVVWTEMQIDATSADRIQLAQPNTRHDFYRDIAVVAFPTPASEIRGAAPRLREWKAKAGFERKNRPERDRRQLVADQVIDGEQILELTDRMDRDGKLDWHPSTGTWTILRIGHTPTGQTNLPAPKEGVGLECDKLNPRAAEVHWQNFIEPIRAQLGSLAGKTLRSVLIDSYEARHQNWTSDFDQEFRHRCGYDLRPWLPAVTGRVIESVDQTERFLWDFRRVIGELVAENYYRKFEQLCHENSLQMAVEPYGYWGVFNDFEVARYGDLLMGEFWTDRPTAWFVPTTKFAASAAHADGRPVVGAEAFTSGLGSAGWLNYPARLKALGDHYYCQGLNRVIFHTCVHQPWLSHRPGMTMWRWGMQMNRHNTLAEEMGPWLRYMARSQYLLQQGEFVADLCYLADEDTPNSPTTCEQLCPPPPAGYDYDAIAASTLDAMEVRDGKIRLPSGMTYRALVLPDSELLRPELLKSALRLADAGGMIVASVRPTASPSLSDSPNSDQLVQKLADDLWSQRNFREALTTVELGAVLSELGITPDVTCDDAELGTDIEYIHRRTANADIYFLSNQRDRRLSCRPVFRVLDRTPEIWSPETGASRPATVWTSLGNQGTQVDLQLAPAESVFVVFRTPKADRPQFASLTNSNHLSNGANGTTQRVVIEKAVYGRLAGQASERADVTKLIQNYARDGRCRVPVSNYLAKDPAPNQPKQLLVRYRIDGAPREDVIPEHKWWTLDASSPVGPPRAGIETVNNQATLVTYASGRHELGRADGPPLQVEVPTLPTPQQIAGPWSVEFGDLANNRRVEFNELRSWSEHADDLIRHYSGTATYRISFNLAAEQTAEGVRHWLDLGDVEVLAELQVNNGPAVSLWKSPYATDITRWTRPGRNELEVKVINLWANRLIGDERFSADYSIDRSGSMSQVPAWLEHDEPRPSEERKAIATFKHWAVDDALLPSGLLGPVQLYFGREIDLSGIRPK